MYRLHTKQGRRWLLSSNFWPSGRDTGAIETEKTCSIWLSDSGCLPCRRGDVGCCHKNPTGVARAPLRRRGCGKEPPSEPAVVETQTPSCRANIWEGDCVNFFPCCSDKIPCTLRKGGLIWARSLGVHPIMVGTCEWPLALRCQEQDAETHKLQASAHFLFFISPPTAAPPGGLPTSINLI